MLAGACKREVVNQYQIQDVNLYTSASQKKNLKSDDQFISILYTDIYGKSITNKELQNLNRTYTSIGDKSLIIDVLIKSLLADAAADIPTKNSMHSDPKTFVEETYRRFLIRQPTQQESWFLENRIEKDSSLSPMDVYYAILTSEEYRYY